MRRSALIVCALLAGCPGPGPIPPGDGGVPLADGDVPDAPGVSGRVGLVLDAEADSLEDDVVLERFAITIAEARARNDRGGDLEPFVSAVGTRDLATEPLELMLDGAVPATYGRATIELRPDGEAPSLELVLVEAGIRLHVVDDHDITLDARCDVPAALGPSQTVTLTLEIPVGELHGAVRSAPLPAEDEGEILVDTITAPEAILALEQALRDGVHLECSAEGSP